MMMAITSDARFPLVVVTMRVSIVTTITVMMYCVCVPAGGYGNMRRVGHDITSNWKSMVSLVDIASNLWPYARNDTNSTYGGWFNDLDMVGGGRTGGLVNAGTDAIFAAV